MKICISISLMKVELRSVPLISNGYENIVYQTCNNIVTIVIIRNESSKYIMRDRAIKM